MTTSPKRAAAFLWNNIGYICVALAAVFCVVHAFDPPRLNWGDSGSDFNAMGSGRNFQKYGFLNLRLTPFLLDPAVMTVQNDRVFIYVHYPQLPDLMNGLLRVVFRLSDIVQFRFVALCFSFSALFFVYRLVERFWGRLAAQIAVALWVTNPLWIQHADYLHHIPYGAFFGFGSLYALCRYLDDVSRRRWLGIAGFMFAMAFMASYDWWFFGPLLVLFVASDRFQAIRPAIPVLSIMAAAGAAAILFKLGTNAWALDGIEPWLRDLRFQFAERATDRITRTNYQSGAWETLYGRVERFFTLLLFPVTLFWVFFPLVRPRMRRWIPAVDSVRANPLMVLLAALPFLLMFMEIWVAQYYPGVLVVPFYAIGCAVVAAMLFDAPAVIAKTASVVFVLALLGNAADENLSFPAEFFPRAVIARMGPQLDSLSPRVKEVLVNHGFDAQYRYYFNRKIVGMTLIPPRVSDQALISFANPGTHPRTADRNGTIFIQHKQVVDQLYDKGYYYVLGRYHLWNWWGNPRKNRSFIDQFVRDRDSTLMANVAKVGFKVYDDPYYSIWRIPPQPDSVKAADSPGFRPPIAPAAVPSPRSSTGKPGQFR